MPEARAGLTIAIIEIKKTEKQKAMDRKADQKNLVASNAGVSITSPRASKYVFSFSLQAGTHCFMHSRLLSIVRRLGYTKGTQFSMLLHNMRIVSAKKLPTHPWVGQLTSAAVSCNNSRALVATSCSGLTANSCCQTARASLTLSLARCNSKPRFT